MKVIVTSCMDAERDPVQPIWEEIERRSPDVLMLLGDNIYMDWGDLGESNFKKYILESEKKGLEAFALEMHRRYEKQWAVPSFQSCIRNLRNHGKQLFVCWDDHDFAWNNSFRQGSIDEKHAVPIKVMHISQRLFKQYEQHLKTNFKLDKYPDIPVDWSASLDTDCSDVDQIQLLRVGDDDSAVFIPFHLLDTRWYRTSRDETPRTLLGNKTIQRQKLMEAAAKQDGLLIVAGGTPMKHSYLMADDGWASKTSPALDYPEYDELLSSANRPVLYLSGDIHRNAFGGTLMRRNAANGGWSVPSSVIQILASGAGIGRYGPVRFQPSFAELLITCYLDGSGTVEPLLLNQSDNNWLESPPAPRLTFNRNSWNEVYAGESYGDPKYVIDDQPLSCITTRDREKPYKNQVCMVRDCLEAFDSGDAAVFRQSLREDGICDATYIAPVIGTTKLEIKRVNPTVDSASMTTVIKRAFEYAKQVGKKSVVFYIHGMGKTHAQAIEQAYAIRQLYPDCEPIAFTWPAGAEGGGFFSALGQFAVVKDNAVKVGSALRVALETFNNVGVQYPDLKKVVLVRSAGSIAMNHAVNAGNVDVIKNIDAIVLSAPLLKLSTFHHFNTVFQNVAYPVWVTVNTRDGVLNKADLADFKFGEVLGKALPIGPVNLRFHYFDFSQATAVNRLHDYIFTPIPHAKAVHAGLLSGGNPIESLINNGNIKSTNRKDTFKVN